MLTLKRFQYEDEMTLGKLYFKDIRIGFTLELAWNDNKKFKSCIPEGCYFITVEADEGRVRIEEVEGRYGILIHSGNYVHETQGCVLLAERLGVKNDEFCVINSFETLLKLVELCDKEVITMIRIEKEVSL